MSHLHVRLSTYKALRKAVIFVLSIMVFLKLFFASKIAKASSQYLFTQAHVIFCFLPQVTQTGPSGVYPET